MRLSAERLAALRASKLRALVGRARPEVDLAAADARPFPDGAVLAVPGGPMWVLISGPSEQRLGGVLALAAKLDACEVEVVIDPSPDAEGVDQAVVADAGEVLARRAAAFTLPVAVWCLSGDSLEPVAGDRPASVDPEPIGASSCVAALVAAGLDPVVEGGVLRGELRGLEVARAVSDRAGDHDVDGWVAGEPGFHIEAGVGRFDREVGAMMFAELAEVEALDRVVAIVDRYRRADAPRHPLNQLVRERWLRSVVVSCPELVGASRLHPVGSARPRANLLEPGVATAVGADVDGRPLVVTCGVGPDLDLVPAAADDHRAHGDDARLLIVIPEGDALPSVTAPMRWLARPAELVAVPADWPSLRSAN